MAVDLEERPQNPQPEQHDDSITHAFILWNIYREALQRFMPAWML